MFRQLSLLRTKLSTSQCRRRCANRGTSEYGLTSYDTRGKSLEVPLAGLRKSRIDETANHSTQSSEEDIARIVRETINAMNHGPRPSSAPDLVTNGVTRSCACCARVMAGLGASTERPRMGVKRTTLLSRIKRLGINPKQFLQLHRYPLSSEDARTRNPVLMFQEGKQEYERSRLGEEQYCTFNCFRRCFLSRKGRGVTGATRGIGKGIATVLGERGATFTLRGRTTAVTPNATSGTINSGTISEVAEVITAAGGVGIAFDAITRTTHTSRLS